MCTRNIYIERTVIVHYTRVVVAGMLESASSRFESIEAVYAGTQKH